MRLASFLAVLLLVVATAGASAVPEASDALDAVVEAAAPVSSLVPASVDAGAQVGPEETVRASVTAAAEGGPALDIELAPALPHVPALLPASLFPPLSAGVALSAPTLPTLARHVADAEPRPREGVLSGPFREEPSAPPPPVDDVGLVSLVGAPPSGPTPQPPPVALPLPGPEAPLDAPGGVATLALATTALLGALAGLYSRFQKHTLLRSEVRARIHARVLQAPGATIPDLCAETGLSRNALVHHCHLLEKHGLLASRHDGLRRRFYPPGERPSDERPLTPKEARLLDLVRERGPLTQAELAALLGVSRQTLHEQVKRLQASRRLVPQEGAGKLRFAHVEPEAAPTLAAES